MIEEGTHQSLMANDGGNYRAMVDTQYMESIDGGGKEDTVVKQTNEEVDKVPRNGDEDVPTDPIDASMGIVINRTSSKGLFVFLRLLSMSRPEWIAILIGCLACIVVGAVQPFYAIFVAKIVNVSD